MNMCKNIKIRILAFMMAFWLAFSVSYNDYQEVKALEWAIPTVAFDTALKFLLGLLGVSLTSKALHDNVDWNQVQQNCMYFQIQKGNDAVAVGEWWEDVAKGTLNQASSCWSSFKEWVQSLLNDDVVSGSYVVPSDNIFNLSSFSFSESYINSANSYKYFVENGYTSILYDNATNTLSIIIYATDVSGSKNDKGQTIRQTFTYNDKTVYYSVSSETTLIDFEPTANEYLKNRVYDVQKCAWLMVYGGFTTDIPSDDAIFDSANDKIEDTAITTGDATTTAIPDTLPLPWDNVSDTAEGVDDAISGLQEQVAEGVISLEDYWERIQELVNAMAIDTTTDETLPVTQNPDTGENETIQDKVQENVSNTAFTLAGMEKVFPFCIPWDIYSFVTLLVAEPVAPKINYPFYNPATKESYNIEIDFAEWESVVVLFRYILDFLLIIGLLLLARQLAGAGGDN